MNPVARRIANRLLSLATAVGLVALAITGFAGAASASAYYPISGSGSTWSENAINQWIADVAQYGMQVNYAGVGSTSGRQAYIEGTVDFAASDIPFQTDPGDGSAPETPRTGSYAYMPITAGGTAFMYNLVIDGARVTNLRLSGQNIAKIFTGQITNWDDPALAADNPGLHLPDRPIVPVVRSDGAGSSDFLSQWMISQYPAVWKAYCQATGRSPECGATSFWPTLPSSNMVAQSGDLGVAGYVAQNYADGAIGYVNYSYALNEGFPVVAMLNDGGYYVTPTPENVAVSLLAAKVDTTDVNNPALYLTQNLQGVYTDTDPRTYPLSSYSYLILPTAVQGQFTAAKGNTLAAFSYYAMCQGQQQSASLGYSPMPINLVEAAFQQIAKIPGAVTQSINIQSCDNPTFTSNGTNLLADQAPQPPACDKQGSTQCSTATGGAAGSPAASSSSGSKTVAPTTVATSSNGSGTSTATHTSSSGTGLSPSGGSAGSTSGGGSSAATTGTGGTGAVTGNSGATDSASVGAGLDSSGSSSQSAQEAAGADPLPSPTTLPDSGGWGTAQILMVLGVVLLLLLVSPALVIRLLHRPEQ